MRFSSSNIVLSFFVLFNLGACQGQELKTTKIDTPTPKKELKNLEALSLGNMAMQQLFGVEDIASYSSSVGIEEYGTPDAFFAITYQTAGVPFYYVYLYLDGKLKRLQRLQPAKSKLERPLTEEKAKEQAIFLVEQVLKSKKGVYNAPTCKFEKVSGNIKPYYELLFTKAAAKPSKVVLPQSILMKINPETSDVMTIVYDY